MKITKHWLRFWRSGPGIAWKPADAPLLFSERNGHERTMVLCGWRFKWLAAWPKSPKKKLGDAYCERCRRLNIPDQMNLLPRCGCR